MSASEYIQKDNNVYLHIQKLTEREEHLYGKESLTAADVQELHKTRLELDQYWDLLRSRRALRNAGENPGGAILRSSDEVEHDKD